MKTLFLSLILLCALSTLYAQSGLTVDSKIGHVTVYRQGAQVTRTATVELTAGETQLLFKKLPFQLQEESLQLKIDQSVTVVSIAQEVNYLNEADSDSLTAVLQEQQLTLRDSLQALSNRSQVYVRERDLLLANQSLGGNNGVAVDELERAAVLYRTRLMDIEGHLQRIRQQSVVYKKQMVRLGNQLLELNAKSEADPEVIVKVVVNTPKAIPAEVELQYVVPKAGWDPFYNIRVEGTEQPLTLDYKAKVYQDAGEDWLNTRLTLSTGNPTVSNVKPGLSPYYLTFNNYYAPPARQPVANRGRSQRVSGTVLDQETGEPLIGASVLVEGTTIGAVTDMEGRFELEIPAGQPALLVSYVGYANQQVVVMGSTVNVRLSSKGMMLDEVMVMGMASGVRSKKARPKPEKPAPVPIAIEQRATSTEFEIELPYTIPADHQPYDVHMATYEVPANYHYALVPKLSKEAYLIAEITDWSQYSLLNGDANLFFKGTYQGDTYLDMAAFEDTLSLSVGRDEDIIVKRERVRDQSRTSFLGSNKTVERSWKTTIRNTNSYPVSLRVEDQYPLPKDDDIKVVQLGHEGGKLNEATGTVTWSFNLPAGATAERTLKYAVRYPKKQRLLVD
ncbi:mucoidy inhibitor MuiA family protein [Phaeodactylibacter xiamenensis]|uniref:mucoidy inhibitor MuiA family protein n=1 Tax=Phaeodactylibacter xiamenensis TaxID=1524460 RepID=UPI003BAC7611